MKHNKELTHFAQKLRKEMTKEEKHLWYQYLRTYPIQLRRQVTCGQYILDFYCAKAKAAIELDGSQHFQQDAINKDTMRSEYLASVGIAVLRIPNNAIWENFPGVCEQVDMFIKERVNQSL